MEVAVKVVTKETCQAAMEYLGYDITDSVLSAGGWRGRTAVRLVTRQNLYYGNLKTTGNYYRIADTFIKLPDQTFSSEMSALDINALLHYGVYRISYFRRSIDSKMNSPTFGGGGTNSEV